MEYESEIDLIRHARQQEKPAITAIYDSYNQAIYYYALHLLGDPSLAEDCTAETFTRLLKALKAGYGPDDHLKAYLFRCAHNWITDQYRREPAPPLELPESLQESESGSISEQAEVNIVQQRVRHALRLLTPEQRQVIVLRFIEGWEIEEVAASLNKTIGAVKALQHRAISTLQKILLEEKIGLTYEFE